MTRRNTENIIPTTDLSIEVVVQPEDAQGMTTARQTRPDDQDPFRLNDYLSNLSLHDTQPEMGTLTATATTASLSTTSRHHPFHTSASLQRLQTPAFRSIKSSSSSSSSITPTARSISRTNPQLPGLEYWAPSTININLAQAHRPTSASPLAPLTPNISTPSIPSTPILQQRAHAQPTSTLPVPKLQSTLASLLSPILYLYSPRSSLPPDTCANLSHTLSQQNLSQQISANSLNIIALSTLIASILLESCAPVRDEEIKRVEKETRLQGEERCGGWDEGWVQGVAARWEGIVVTCLDDVARYKARARR